MARQIEKTVNDSLQGLRSLLVRRFGKGADDWGQATIFIGRNKIELTNSDGIIIASGPAQVAKLLTRKAREK